MSNSSLESETGVKEIIDARTSSVISDLRRVGSSILLGRIEAGRIGRVEPTGADRRGAT
jgi:hypothetical protein